MVEQYLELISNPRSSFLAMRVWRCKCLYSIMYNVSRVSVCSRSRCRITFSHAVSNRKKFLTGVVVRHAGIALSYCQAHVLRHQAILVLAEFSTMLSLYPSRSFIDKLHVTPTQVCVVGVYYFRHMHAPC